MEILAIPKAYFVKLLNVLSPHQRMLLLLLLCHPKFSCIFLHVSLFFSSMPCSSLELYVRFMFFTTKDMYILLCSELISCFLSMFWNITAGTKDNNNYSEHKSTLHWPYGSCRGNRLNEGKKTRSRQTDICDVKLMLFVLGNKVSKFWIGAHFFGKNR